MENNNYSGRGEKHKIYIEKQKKTRGLTFISVVTMIAALFFSAYLVYDSQTKINMYWQIINAGFILVFTLMMILGFKKACKGKTSLAVLASIILILWGVFNGLVMNDILKLPTQSYLPNFINKEITKGINWTEKNNKEYQVNYEYSDTVEKFNIIAQNKEAKTLTKNIKEITFTVSNGPNYEKTVIMPSLIGLSIDEAVKIIDENFLNNVTVNFVESDEERDIVLTQSKIGEMKRNDELILTVSIGKLENLTSITLEDLKNKTEFKATLYLKRNGIKHEITYEFSDKIPRGSVINTDPKEGTEVEPGDTVKLIVSKGEKIVVPDLNSMTMAEVTKWITENNLSIKYSEKYDNEIPLGSVISSNKNKGDIIEEGTIIELTISKGPLKMEKFKKINEFKTWANVNGVKYELKEEFNDNVPKDEIIKMSVKEKENINLDEKITVTVSKGKAVTVPNLVGKTKNEIEKLCSENKLSCKFNYNYSDSITKGKSIKQSISSGEKVSENESITITLSNGKAPTKTTNKGTSNTTSSSSNNSKPNNSGDSSKPQVTYKTFDNIYIQTSWLGSSDPSTNCNKIRNGIQSQTSTKVKITCSTVASNDGRGKGKIHENSPYQGNKQYSFTEGKTYNFILVE